MIMIIWDDCAEGMIIVYNKMHERDRS